MISFCPWCLLLLVVGIIAVGCSECNSTSVPSVFIETGDASRSVMLHFGLDYFEQYSFPENSTYILTTLIEEGDVQATDFQKSIKFYIQEHDLAQAKMVSMSWAEVYPQDKLAFFYYGSLMIILGDIDEGLVLWETAKSLSVDWKVKISFFEDKVLASSIDNVQSLIVLELGRAFAVQNEWALALACFQTVVELEPEYAEGWALYSEALIQNHLDGENALDNALTLNPGSANVQVFAAVYWRRKGDYSRALSHMQTAATLEPGEAMWSAEIGNLLALSGDINLALSFYQQATKQEPENSLYWQFLARFCADYGIEIRTVGLPAARKALILSPEDSQAHEVMGEILYKLNDLSGAERFLQQAILDDKRLFARLRLGQIYLQEQRLDQAFYLIKDVAQRADAGSIEYELAHRLLEQYFRDS